ncbi:DUF6624 domain-containing protein [Mucilaginibacter sp. CSA2-8R]|uniref:DUF6624 domain-containing protein n=1 Tax=Mucilaginibacter sp. CSA2-8R TaxID=3141542 RepID=UPI00315D67E8
MMFSISVSSKLQAQSVNKKYLRRQLDSIMSLDQKYRGYLSDLSNTAKKIKIAAKFQSTAEEIDDLLWNKQKSIDSANLLFVEKVIDQYGYPGKKLVGTPTNEVAWNVIQHSPKIDKYIDVVAKAAHKNDLPFFLYATMQDRYLVNKHQKQIYGTQAAFRQLKRTGKNDWFIWPIANPQKVNLRRKKAGFKNTVEENAKLLDINYEVLDLSDFH